MTAALKYTPLESPDDLKRRHAEQMEMAELRHRFGPNVVLLSSTEAAGCAANGAIMHVRLTQELATWREAKDLARELFG